MYIRGQEHKPLDLDDEILSKFNLSLNWKDGKILGLHNSKGGICPGNYIGVVWIGEGDNRVVLRVDSKFPKMDYMKMFAECCEHPIIGEYMPRCFDCWAEQELIELPDAKDFSLMIVMAYLRELNTLCMLHLRRHFERQRENFIGKVKGKVFVGENIRRNIVRARPDRIFCEYQTISDDILENRILRAALEQAARYISLHNENIKSNECLHRWVHSCRAHLQGVSVTHISRQQFSVARKRGVFSFYRRSLNLAKAVLYRFGLNPHEKINESTQTPPYAIDSAELFERYAQLQLLKKYPNLKALYGRGDNIYSRRKEFEVPVRPDFYVPRSDRKSPQIIDAKYKKLSEKYKDNGTPHSNNDLYQVVSYSQHYGLLNRINENSDNQEKADDIELSLVYPNESPKEQEGEISIFQSTKAFLSPITIYKIPCPTK